MITAACGVKKHEKCGGYVVYYGGYLTTGLATGKITESPCDCKCHPSVEVEEKPKETHEQGHLL